MAMTYPSPTERLRYGLADTELGVALVALSDKGVRAIVLCGDKSKAVRELQAVAPAAELVEEQSAAGEALGQVAGYIESPKRDLHMSLDLKGNALEMVVWQALATIPVGETRSYGELAKSLSVPATAQEVGAACAANVVALAVPCHRVVKADGSISGYRWGINRKRRLLEKEFLSCRF
jgi:AraC family transcriptional regulator, regulatory protein of adaptative response / methylated-DNA-[protein]-cysteine methyltransferase